MSKEFVKMMVLDGCFIVELFLRLNQLEQKDKPDPIFRTTWMLPTIRYDMLLLENQIPYLVLQRIFEMASPENVSLEDLALDFFDEIMPINEKIQIKGSYYHLLHLFHSHLLPSPNPSRHDNSATNEEQNQTAQSDLQDTNKAQLPPQMIPSAADLQFAGVKLKKNNDKFSSILDVKFSNGVLEIPQLWIDDYTDTLLRNLVAFEQYLYPDGGSSFTTYVIFMDRLINTSKDVALLHRNRIIDHSLGSDEVVALLFNRLCSGICDDLKDNYLTELQRDVEKHCNTAWNMWWASLMQDYFSNPWASLSSLAAVILLLLTITQTIFTIPISTIH